MSEKLLSAIVLVVWMSLVELRLQIISKMLKQEAEKQ